MFLTLVYFLATDEDAVIYFNGELIERYSKLEKKTCLKCIRQLSVFGYLHYHPTNDPRLKSKIVIELPK